MTPIHKGNGTALDDERAGLGVVAHFLQRHGRPHHHVPGELLTALGILLAQPHLVNLLANAIRHTPRGGSVTVSIERLESGEVRLAVSNPGETIPPEHLPRLFERFYRVDPARQRANGGTGLGLAIAKSIVQAHKGRIGVSSAEGTTCFEAVLPAGGPKHTVAAGQAHF